MRRNHGHGHGKKDSAGTNNHLPLSLLASPQPPTQTATLRANADKKHPSFADFAQKVNQRLEQTGEAIREAHKKRVEEDEAIRESVRRKSAPPPPSLPSQPSTQDQHKLERKKAFDQHMRMAQSYFMLQQFSLARFEYESAFRIKLDGHNVQTDLLWALVGVNKFLLSAENASIYLNIAECHMHLKEYQNAFNYLKQLDFPGTPVIDIKTRIQICTEKLHPKQTTVPTTRHVEAHVEVHDAQPVIQTSAWDRHSNEFATTAKRLLEIFIPNDPDNPSVIDSLLGWVTVAIDYQATLTEVDACIRTYDTKCQKPTHEESGLRSDLGALQNKLKTLVSKQEQEANRVQYQQMAKDAEPEIIKHLHNAQRSLASRKFDDALSSLRSAQALAQNNHAEFMANKAFAQKDFLTPSITELKLAIDNFNRTRSTEPSKYAEFIVREALPIKSTQETKHLFFTHQERIIGYLSSAIESNWLHFYGKTFSDLKHFIFQHASDLIRSDLIEIGFNQWFWRGGFTDDLKLDHSNTLGPVLVVMIENLSMRLDKFAVDLPIFAQTNTSIAITPIPTAQLPNYNWRATLEQWPTLVEHTEIYGAQYAVVSAPPLDLSPIERVRSASPNLKKTS